MRKVKFGIQRGHVVGWKPGAVVWMDGQWKCSCGEYFGDDLTAAARHSIANRAKP